MNEKQLSRLTPEQQLLSKAVIKLPPRQRLELLLNANTYPILRKRTSAEGQIKEMIAFYNICCIILAMYFPNEEAEDNFLILSLIASQENTQSIISTRLAKLFSILGNYEKLESKITAIQMLFYQYLVLFPELYELYNLDYIVTKHISDIIRDTRKIMNDNPQLIKEILKHWELIS